MHIFKIKNQISNIKNTYQKHKNIFIFLVCVFDFWFLIFGFSNLIFAKDGGSIDLDKVSIPKEFGLVKEVYQSPLRIKKDERIIFHIQDVHVNYEAQKSLANILEYLIKEYGLEVILVEGGITDKDFSYIREWAPIEERREKAEELLKEGIISGETYVDIATDLPLKFQGIEDKGLYESNMESYLKVESFRPDALNLIGIIKDNVERLKKFIYTRQLKEFDKYKSDYKSEKAELVEYFKYLDELASKEGVDLERFPNHRTLLEIAHLEKGIDFKKVEKERDNLIKRLTDILPKKNYNKLILKSIEFKEGKRSPGEFYSYLEGLSIQQKINLKKYKNLSFYTKYISTYERLEREKLFKEVNEIEDILSDVLCKNDQQKRLFMISKNLSILESLLRLKLTPEDYDYYKTNKRDFDIKGWNDFLLRHSKRFRIGVTIPRETSVIDGNFGTLESFYDVSFRRDEAFLRNSIKKMEKERARLAVLIAGGFHTKNLTRLFTANDISYIVITPKVTQKTDDALYDRILKESYRTRIWNNE